MTDQTRACHFTEIPYRDPVFQDSTLARSLYPIGKIVINESDRIKLQRMAARAIKRRGCNEPNIWDAQESLAEVKVCDALNVRFVMRVRRTPEGFVVIDHNPPATINDSFIHLGSIKDQELTRLLDLGTNITRLSIISLRRNISRSDKVRISEVIAYVLEREPELKKLMEKK